MDRIPKGESVEEEVLTPPPVGGDRDDDSLFSVGETRGGDNSGNSRTGESTSPAPGASPTTGASEPGPSAFLTTFSLCALNYVESGTHTHTHTHTHTNKQTPETRQVRKTCRSRRESALTPMREATSSQKRKWCSNLVGKEPV
jgi:hypothetical protein